MFASGCYFSQWPVSRACSKRLTLKKRVHSNSCFHFTCLRKFLQLSQYDGHHMRACGCLCGQGYVCMDVHVHIYIPAYMCMYVCVQVCVYVYMYVYVCKYVCIWASVCMGERAGGMHLKGMIKMGMKCSWNTWITLRRPHIVNFDVLFLFAWNIETKINQGR